MMRREFLVSSALGAVGVATSQMASSHPGESPDVPVEPASVRATRKILIAGGGFNTAFIRYMATLTGKSRPRLCYLPTAAADNVGASLGFFPSCAPLHVEPHVQHAFIESLSQTQSWEEVLLSMD
jgi:hypothetical protein